MDEERTGDEIRRGDAFNVASKPKDDGSGPVARNDVAPATLKALELVAHGFDLQAGRAKVEITYEAGRFEVAWITRRLTLKSLTEFEPVFRAAPTDVDCP
jgi:hypothetical protein